MPPAGVPKDPLVQTLFACHGCLVLALLGGQSDTLVPLAGQTASDQSPSRRGLGGAVARVGPRLHRRTGRTPGGDCESQRAVLESVHWDALPLWEKGARSSPEPVPEPSPPPADKSWGSELRGIECAS